jgi:diphosphomevalonate decarboxylase
MSEPMPTVICTASPSLALLKYWGKRNVRRNSPATPSIGVTVGALTTITRVSILFRGSDAVIVNGERQKPERYAPFFRAVRKTLGSEARFHAESRNDFPSRAGLASSSSGFAALAHACVRAAEAAGRNPTAAPGESGRISAGGLPLSRVSEIALIGSASAARAVYGGFSFLAEGAAAAEPLFGPDHWPELRILVAVISPEAKPLSSREAMKRSRLTSPYYRSWIRSARSAAAAAIDALKRRDLERLGEEVRRSYLRMFAVMLASDPPLIYWLPGSVAAIRECEAMRARGIGVWETMDAGPQVKMLCLAGDAPSVTRAIRESGAASQVIESKVGEMPETTLERPA